MKKLLTKVLVVAMSVACMGLLFGCGKSTSEVSDRDVEAEREMEENDTSKKKKKDKEKETKEEEKESESNQAASIITAYKWQASEDSSLIVCETDGSFKYYQSEEDLTDNYFEGTYEFYMGEEAVTYITTELSEYYVTREELEDIFERNEHYDESNFVIFVLNNEACIMGGENQVESPYQTPYFGFYLIEGGIPYLDIANMNSGNYHLFEGK